MGVTIDTNQETRRRFTAPIQPSPVQQTEVVTPTADAEPETVDSTRSSASVITARDAERRFSADRNTAYRIQQLQDQVPVPDPEGLNPLPSQPPTSPAEEYERLFVETASPEAQAAYDNHERVVLALRTDSPIDANGGRGAFDDEFVVLWKDEDGEQHFRSFEGSLDPNTQYGDDLREDVRVDGPPEEPLGPYGDHTPDSRFNPTDHDKIHVWGRVSGGQTIRMQGGPEDKLYPPPDGGYAVDIDTNGNGVFDDNQHIIRNDNAYQLHGPAEDHTGSAGCMTVRDWEGFMDVVRGGNTSTVETTRGIPLTPFGGPRVPIPGLKEQQEAVYVTIV